MEQRNLKQRLDDHVIDQMPTEPVNSIAQCRWQIEFDEQKEAYQLQEFISHFSHTELIDIIQQAFINLEEQLGDQVIRMGIINLDLGLIEYDQLETELGPKIADCLNRQLAKKVQQLSINSQALAKNSGHHSGRKHWPGNDTGTKRDGLDQHTLEEYHRQFLNSGLVPWWFRRQCDQPIKMLERHRFESPMQLTKLIRELGQQQHVRHRMVMQWGDSGMVHIIELLEPYQHDYILSFASNLHHNQRSTKTPDIHPQRFVQHSWYWILTHLLVDRGSLFNRQTFVKSTLEQMAHQYGLDYSLMLEQLMSTVESLSHKASIVPNFVQAIRGLYNIHSNANNEQSIPQYQTAINYWHWLEHHLTHQQPSGAINTDYHWVELTQVLALKDHQRLARLFSRLGAYAKVREQFINSGDDGLLKLIVKLQAPNDHRFINQHVEQVKETSKQSPDNLTDQSLWRIVLAYLYSDSGSHFNRRQFIRHTVEKHSQAIGLNYETLLSQLIYQSGEVTKFELLTILVDLQSQYQKSNQRLRLKGDSGQSLSSHLDLLAEYWLYGEFTDKSRHSADQLLTWQLIYQPQSLILWFTKHINLDNDIKSIIKQQVMTAIESNFPIMSKQFLNNINPAILHLINGLTIQVHGWQAQSHLIKLPHFAQHLQCWALEWSLDQLVMNGKLELKIEHLLDYLCLQMMARYSVKVVRRWQAQLQTLVASDNNHSSFTPAMKQQLVAICSRLNPADLILTSKQQVDLFIRELRQTRNIQNTRRLNAWLRQHGAGFLLSLMRQTDRQRLFGYLLQLSPHIIDWLRSLSPFNDTDVDDFCAQLTGGGSSNGSMHRCYWAALFEQFAQQPRLLCYPFKASDKQQLLGQWIDATGQYLTASNKSSLKQALNETCLRYQKSGDGTFPPLKALSKSFKASQPLAKSTLNELVMDPQGDYLSQPLFELMLSSWLTTGRFPLWLVVKKEQGIVSILHQVLKQRPMLLHKLLSRLLKQAHGQTVLNRLVQPLSDTPSFTLLLGAMIGLNQGSANNLLMLKAVHQAFNNMRWPSDSTISSKLLTQWLTGQILSSWSNDQWSHLCNDQLIHLIAGYLMKQFGVQKQWVKQAFESQQSLFPADLNFDIDKPINKNHQANLAQPINQEPITATNITRLSDYKKHKAPTLQELPIAVNNAGIVLLQSFFKTYLTRIGVVEGNDFVSDQSRRDAVHWLQMLATGQSQTMEPFLVLNKLLCGMGPSDPICLEIDPTAEQDELCESLITAMIGHWSSIGKSSAEGFRGNWLVRNGLLRETEEYWELTVEKRSYDILLNQSPFSYAQIRLPWMAKPLYVNWSA